MPDPQDKPAPPAHSLADHSYGAMSGHIHAPGDFDHDHDEAFLPVDSRSLESVPFLSMGLDVGSSGTQVVFSRLEMRGPGEIASLRGRLKARETLYMSPVALTPFRDANRIDEDRLWEIVSAAFRAAGLTPDDIETGAVILTGAAAQRANAQPIAERIAAEVGELVCATAGDHMEAQLAAYGSGAVEGSRAGFGCRLLNIDIGGATTKFALIDDGKILATSAVAIGGRQIAVDATGRISRLDPEGAAWARRLGLSWSAGDVAARDDLARIADAMADTLVDIASGRPLPTDMAHVFVTEPLCEPAMLHGIMVSGGVAEYVHLREKRDFGDLGWRLGWALRRRFDAGLMPAPLLPAGECIRATALGASEHSVQISGRTIHISSHADLLPKRNLPVLRVELDGLVHTASDVAAAIRRQLHQFDLDGRAADLALAIPWQGDNDYPRLRALAEGIVAGLAAQVAAGGPLYILLDGDAALTLGAILKDDMALKNHVLVIDGLRLRAFDHVDIGRVRMPSYTVPVTIKSLVFGRAAAPVER
jgi:ethanolamine utilization protein EutA